jgi:hypothetical protein
MIAATMAEPRTQPTPPEPTRIRLIIDTEDEIRRAVRLRALKMGEDVTNSDVVNEILRKALASEILEVRGFGTAHGTGKKPGRKRKEAEE